MGDTFPQYPNEVQDGDEVTHAPNKGDRSLLGAERGTQYTRRLETDADRNLFVHVAADDTGTSFVVAPLAGNGITGVPASTLSTIVTYTAVATTRITRIAVSGTDYAKFQLFLNASLIETRRSSPERSLDFPFDVPLGLAPGDVLDVKVTHYATGVLADFEATIYGA